MELPNSIRESLTNDLEEYLESIADGAEPEMVAAFMVERLEEFADEKGIDDIVVALEESGSLESPLQESLENEISSNEEFEYTEEECVTLLEDMCDIIWVDDETDEESDDETDEEF